MDIIIIGISINLLIAFIGAIYKLIVLFMTVRFSDLASLERKIERIDRNENIRKYGWLSLFIPFYKLFEFIYIVYVMHILKYDVYKFALHMKSKGLY